MKRLVEIFALSTLFALTLLLVSAAPFAAASGRGRSTKFRPTSEGSQAFNCSLDSPYCTEVRDSINYEGHYTGHDEPSVLFYSDAPGSGNSNVYKLRLPTEPPTLPKQNGKGGTYNFQLHIAFWLGMAMCDSQSDPNYTHTCTPDTDANIFDDPSPSSPHWIGHHPGAAFMELQFYPPGWVPWFDAISCDPTKWCAALTIDSYSDDGLTGQLNNADCQDVGVEYVNFAFITKNGKPHAPASPFFFSVDKFTPDPAKDLFMNGGDWIKVDMHDTSDGFSVTLDDLTSGEQGSMVASVANGFAQELWAPTSDHCTEIPYAFHPLYSTSSEHTRVTWTAHTYNVAFSDEIGHFELCSSASTEYPYTCNTGDDDPNTDDYFCYNGSESLLIKIGGCFYTENDFDGTSYGKRWPGTLANVAKDQQLHPSPILFSSPLFLPPASTNAANYSRVAFEADMPRIERPTDSPNNNCDKYTGVGCVNPPNGATFYPFFSNTKLDRACYWQLGGNHIPNTTNNFGGSSVTEFGTSPLLVHYEAFDRYNDFRNILNNNPCPAPFP
jgi:hypothetical protein